MLALGESMVLESWDGNWFPPCPREHVMIVDLVRTLISHGGNIYAADSKGQTPLALVNAATLKSDMLFPTRRSLLVFLDAVCIADNLKCNGSIQRVAEITDLCRVILKFL